MSSEEININLLRGLIPDETIELYLRKVGNLVNELGTIQSLATCPANAVAGASYTYTITPSGGTPPYKVELLVDGVSQGITTTSSAITKTGTYPTSAGSHTFQSRVTDSCSPTPQVKTDNVCTVNVSAPCSPALTLGGLLIDSIVCPTSSITLTPHILNINAASPTIGVGALSYQWTVNGSNFSTLKSPTWTPASAGTYTITVTVKDSCTPTPQSVSKSCTVTVIASTCLPLTSATLTIPSTGTAGSIVNMTSIAAGGQGSYTHVLYRLGSTGGVIVDVSPAGSGSGYTFNGVVLPTTAGTYGYYTTITDTCPTPQSKTSPVSNIIVSSAVCPVLSTTLTIS